MIDPTQATGAGQQPGAQAQPIAVVCIAAMPDGTFMVYPDNDEGQEDAGTGGDTGAGDDEGSEMANGQPAKDAKSAATLAVQMLSSAATAGAPNAGAAAPAPAQDGGDADFLSGFKSARGG